MMLVFLYLQQVIRVYSLPDGTFSSDEEEEEEDDEEDEEEEGETLQNYTVCDTGIFLVRSLKPFSSSPDEEN